MSTKDKKMIFGVGNQGSSLTLWGSSCQAAKTRLLSPVVINARREGERSSMCRTQGWLGLSLSMSTSNGPSS